MTKKTEPRVVVLLSKYHGSNQQLLAIAKHLNHGKVVPIYCELRSRSKVFYLLYRFILWIREVSGLSPKLSNLLIRLVLRNSIQCHQSDIVLAKTPPFEFPLHLLASGSGAKAYFVGNPKRITRDKYDCLISTPSTQISDAEIQLDMMPTSFTYEEFINTRNSLAVDSNCWCLLIGGNARGFSYSDVHWKELVDYVIDSCVSENIRWVISTSPRTGLEAEDYLKRRLTENSGFSGDLHLWSEGVSENRVSVISLLAQAHRVYVTEDSASMLSEAVNTRMPVISLRPKKSEFNSLTTPLVEYHASKNRSYRVEIEDLKTQATSIESWEITAFSPIESCWSKKLFREDQVS
ncbi:ELM1/GtrOC1 family putative glycosyltransferase [Litoribrevibacter euphylliae]|uniref:ELM1/GtrOC1 family putative glycosyltransferase n=1 Tax=Litoribrevibacter euphylliae TaxID=1834034 RepID=A0ABV7HK41_9GAMM